MSPRTGTEAWSLPCAHSTCHTSFRYLSARDTFSPGIGCVSRYSKKNFFSVTGGGASGQGGTAISEDFLGFVLKYWYLHRVCLSLERDGLHWDVAGGGARVPPPGTDCLCQREMLEPNATLPLGRENTCVGWWLTYMSVEPLGLESTPEELMMPWVGTRLFLSYFLKGGHFQPLDNNRWEQVYESNVFDLKSLSFTAS